MPVVFSEEVDVTTVQAGDFRIVREAYTVFLGGVREGLAEVVPFAIGDLGDGDNNHELCLDTDRAAIPVTFPAGRVTDPREDLNEAAEVFVSR